MHKISITRYIDPVKKNGMCKYVRLLTISQYFLPVKFLKMIFMLYFSIPNVLEYQSDYYPNIFCVNFDIKLCKISGTTV